MFAMLTAFSLSCSEAPVVILCFIDLFLGLVDVGNLGSCFVLCILRCLRGHDAAAVDRYLGQKYRNERHGDGRDVNKDGPSRKQKANEQLKRSWPGRGGRAVDQHERLRRSRV